MTIFRLFFLLALFCSFFHISLLASIEEKAKSISNLSASYIYNYDEARIPVVLEPFLKNNPQIEIVEIKDVITGDFLYSYKKNPTQKVDSSLEPLEFSITYDGEIVGKGLLFYQKQSSLSLTKEEMAWLKSNPKIRVHNEYDWTPINFNKNGIPAGLSIDYMNLLAQKIGTEIEYITGEWSDLYTMAINKKLDVMLNIVKTKEREKFLLFTSPYQTNKIGIYSLKNSDLNTIESLEGKKVTVVDGFFQETLLREKYPLIQIVRTKNSQEAIKEVCERRADATIGSFLVFTNLIAEMMCYELEYKQELTTDEPINLRIATHKENHILYSILQKAMASVGANEISEIREKWIIKEFSKPSISFTKDEIEWIKSHPTIKVGGEMDWIPFDFVDESGSYSGLAKEYLDFIAKSTGLKLEIVTNLLWDELLNGLKSGELDMLPAINYSKERAEFFHFTSPYLAISNYYITQVSYPKIENIAELYGKKVSAIKGYEIIGWLRENHPEIEVIEYDNLLDSLRAVESGSVVATINDDPSSTYAIEKNFLANLKINSVVKNRAPIPLYMAVKKGYEPLVTIINKTLSSMDKEQKREIAQKWMSSVESKEKIINFSEQEILWLASKPSIKFAVDPKWLPIEAINPKTKKYDGIMSDYLKRVSELTGVSFELIPTDSWAQSVELSENGAVDMLAALSKTAKREAYLDFSDTTITLTDGVIMRSDAQFITDIEDLEGFRVGISSGTALEKMIKERYPNIKLIPTKGEVDGIMKLDDGEIDAFVGNLEVISHVVFSNNLLNLKVVYRFEKERNLHIALNKNLPKEALSSINKAIEIINRDELELIRKKWIGLKIEDEIDYSLLLKIGAGVVLLFLFISYNNLMLKKRVNQKTAELTRLLGAFDKNVLASKTDVDGVITYVSEAFCEISGFSKDELIGNTHRVVRHPDMDDELFASLWQKICSGDTWSGEIKNRKKDGGFYWVYATIAPEYDKNSELVGFSAIRHDITDKKEVENLSHTLEHKVIDRAIELYEERAYIQSVLNSQENLVFAIGKDGIKSANSAFLKFFKAQSVEDFIEKYGNDVTSLFSAEDGFLQKNIEGESWLEYVKKRGAKTHKILIEVDGSRDIFSINCEEFQFHNEILTTVVLNNITKLMAIQKETEDLHRHTRESIEYASLIQHSLIPSNNIFEKYFSEYLTIWQPKDIVGGDIYLFEELRSDDECLLMVIDCTGHGVPGAFVTMLVKAIERQIISEINHSQEIVSPAKLLSVFNRSMKQLLNQNSKDSISNAGFDGAILYYNKREKRVKFAGTNTPLFYENGDKIEIIKGDRHSVGYRKSDLGYEFKEYEIEVKSGMRFFITTDGYLDQNGGERDFPFGKKAFKALLESNLSESFADIQEILMQTLLKYQGSSERNDDITIIGIRI